MKQEIDVFDYAGTICHALRKGVLLTTKAGDKVNTMTIGWGKIGVEWNRPVFIAYVRESRFTKSILDENGEFTVNIPYGVCDSKILGYCGNKSGRDTDKIQDLSLTLEPPVAIQVPGIRELPLTLECKVIYQQLQDLAQIPEEIRQQFYPGQTPDLHIAYYGEIVGAYIIKE